MTFWRPLEFVIFGTLSCVSFVFEGWRGCFFCLLFLCIFPTLFLDADFCACVCVCFVDLGPSGTPFGGLGPYLSVLVFHSLFLWIFGFRLGRWLGGIGRLFGEAGPWTGCAEWTMWLSKNMIWLGQKLFG